MGNMDQLSRSQVCVIFVVKLLFYCSLNLEPLALAISPYGWLMTHYGWLAG